MFAAPTARFACKQTGPPEISRITVAGRAQPSGVSTLSRATQAHTPGSPVIRGPNRAAPPPGSCSEGSPIPGCRPHELVVFLTGLATVGQLSASTHR